ncbi:MAG: hypothetical protein JO288_19400 [Hyphomicrobiales bacterium]|nr:hypothetical protein [Hyphomicrobiales bacterium]
MSEIEKGNADAVVALLNEHLKEIEAGIDVTPPKTDGVDLASVLATA